MECIYADGSAIHPLIIFKGENLQTEWIPSAMDKEWNWSCNTKGWTCDRIAKEWIKHVFEPTTCAKANGEKRILICDCHGLQGFHSLGRRRTVIPPLPEL